MSAYCSAGIGRQKTRLLVTDKPLFELGILHPITQVLDEIRVSWDVYHDVEPDPTLSNVNRGLEQLRQFQPDVIIAVGGDPRWMRPR